MNALKYLLWTAPGTRNYLHKIKRTIVLVDAQHENCKYLGLRVCGTYTDMWEVAFQVNKSEESQTFTYLIRDIVVKTNTSNCTFDVIY